jgi:hypothetical protein
MALAGKVLGPGAPQWQRLEAICQEYLAAHPVEPSESEREQVLRWPVHVSEWMESAKEALEEETRRWAFLCPVEPVAAPIAEPVAAPAALGEDGDADPHRLPQHLPHHLDAELRALKAMRDGWDEFVGHLGLLVSMLGLWRDMGFASFGHYCAERLGMAARTVEQRVWLERRLYALPPLRRALRDGRVGYEKARLVAAHADDTTVEALRYLPRSSRPSPVRPKIRPSTTGTGDVRGAHLDLRDGHLDVLRLLTDAYAVVPLVVILLRRARRSLRTMSGIETTGRARVALERRPTVPGPCRAERPR